MRTNFTTKKIEEIINYLDNKLDWTDIRLITKLLTNWLIEQENILSLTSLFNWIQISWDWNSKNNPRFWWNKQIWKQIWENIWLFKENWTKVNILIVVSENNYENLEQIIDELYNTYNIEDIVLSLKDYVWRASQENIKINYDKLRKIYVKLWKKYRQYNIDIPLTWTDIHSISNYPCWISVPNFSISPSDIISACTLSFNNNLNGIFDIWKIDDKSMILNEIKIKKLQTLSVLWIKNCNECFVKWHCRGWCIYANKWEWLWNINPWRCEMIKKIIADKILFLAWIK